MKNIFQILIFISAIALVFSIILQHRGVSLGGAFGGEGGFYRTKRGIEKFLFYLTIVAALVFFISLVVNIFVIK